MHRRCNFQIILCCHLCVPVTDVVKRNTRSAKFIGDAIKLRIDLVFQRFQLKAQYFPAHVSTNWLELSIFERTFHSHRLMYNVVSKNLKNVLIAFLFFNVHCISRP